MEDKKFEDLLSRLEKVVKRLEEGELPLDTSLKLFEEGIELSKWCGEKLEGAQRKIEILTQSPDGQKQISPFNLKKGTEEDEHEF